MSFCFCSSRIIGQRQRWTETEREGGKTYLETLYVIIEKKKRNHEIWSNMLYDFRKKQRGHADTTCSFDNGIKPEAHTTHANDVVCAASSF